MTEDLTLHATLARSLNNALRDLGVDLVGCKPELLTGHIIKELKTAGFRRTVTPEQIDAAVVAADEATNSAWSPELESAECARAAVMATIMSLGLSVDGAE